MQLILASNCFSCPSILIAGVELNFEYPVYVFREGIDIHRINLTIENYDDIVIGHAVTVTIEVIGDAIDMKVNATEAGENIIIVFSIIWKS